MQCLTEKLETIIRKSVADDRRIQHMHDMGASDDECPYHTAYEWADGVDDLIHTLEIQLAKLEDVYKMLYGLEHTQSKVLSAINQIREDIREEEAIAGEFWAHQPDNFERR